MPRWFKQFVHFFRTDMAAPHEWTGRLEQLNIALFSILFNRYHRCGLTPWGSWIYWYIALFTTPMVCWLLFKEKSRMKSSSKTWLWWWGTSLTLVSLSMASLHFQTLPNLGIPVQGITLSNVWLEVVNLCCNHLHFSKLCWSNQNRAYFQLSNSRPRHLLAIPCVCTVCDSGSTLQYWLF